MKYFDWYMILVCAVIIFVLLTCATLDSRIDTLEYTVDSLAEPTPLVYSVNEIPTEYLEGEAIRLQEAQEQAYEDGCIYAIDNLTVTVDPDNPGMVYINLELGDGAVERYGVPVADYVSGK